MKHTYILNADDITAVLAKYFKVDVKKVKLQPYITIEGYGMGEHQVADVTANIEEDIYLLKDINYECDLNKKI